jgi:hypothetical protein
MKSELKAIDTIKNHFLAIRIIKMIYAFNTHTQKHQK